MGVKKNIIEYSVFALLGALLIVVQTTLAFLPNIELVSILIIVYTVVFGFKALIPTFVFVLAEWIIYGFGIWSINYIYVWPILVFLSFAFRKMESPVFWAILNGFFGLSFGFLCAIAEAFIGGISFGITYFINGIPFDIMHCIGNTATALMLFVPLKKALTLASKKIGII